VGKLPISSIRTAHLRPVIKHIAERGAPTVAILVRQWCSQLFAYAAGEELCDSDPTALLKRSVKRPRVRHHPPLSWQEIPNFLNRVDDAGYGGQFSSHGFRSTATTLLGLLSYPENRVVQQLAHSKRKKDSSRAPYDHTKYIASRIILMQDWADILDALARGDTFGKIMEDFGPMSERRVMLWKTIEME